LDIEECVKKWIEEGKIKKSKNILSPSLSHIHTNSLFSSSIPIIQTIFLSLAQADIKADGQAGSYFLGLIMFSSYIFKS